MDAEERLLERLRVGDEEAFSRLVDAYQERIYYLALRRVGDPDCASDITQNTFLRAYRAMGRFRGQASLRTWLHRIAVNLCKNHFRDAGRARRMAERYAVQCDLRERERAAARGREGFAEIRHHVERLPDRQRETLMLRVLEELTFKEIGEAMECSVGTAKSNYYHAVRNLRAMVLSEGRLAG